MRRLRWIAPLVPVLIACNGGATKDLQPLGWGDAEWPDAPIPEPGSGGGGDDDDGEDDGDNTSGAFVPGGDIPAVAQCDPFQQDCPEGEKCVAYASSGGTFDANKCVAVVGAQLPGDPCTYGGVVEATDDCNALSYCWDVVDMSGACAQFCQGAPDAPICPDGLECLIDYDGSLNLCVDGSGETDTGTDTGTDTSTDEGLPDVSDPEPVFRNEPVCPDEQAPLVLYMSNDDSNSQASPVLVRRAIHQGQLVDDSLVRIHEFLNYYTISTDYPEDQPAKVGMQMRRTDAETGEFTLLLTASGQQLREEQRPPLNVVFSLDTSGSMAGEPLERIKDSMRALAGELRAGDVISMVRWSNQAAVVLESHHVAGPDDWLLLTMIDALDSDGSTDLHNGLVTAYELAEASYIEGGINRVILMSDGGANAGITDIDIIAEAAAAEDGSGIYLVGVGMSDGGYGDPLMDALTDAGKGAHVFIDTAAEAELQFGDRFLSNVAVAARNVQMRVTLPWYFGIKSFHGEEYSADPAEVEPQHLAPNDSMNFHQIIAACDPASIDAGDVIEAHVEYLHPLTLEPMSDSFSLNIGALVKGDADQLHKADAVVAFAKAIIVIDALRDDGEHLEALETAQAMQVWLSQAAATLGDAELAELAQLMADYAIVLGAP